jgi:hypothetical protein
MSKKRQTNLLEFFGNARGESTAITATLETVSQEGNREGGRPIPSGHTRSSFRRAKEDWENITIVTYNVESISGMRLQELILTCKEQNVDIMIGVGTRSNFSGDCIVKDYKIFFEAHGNEGTELMTGVIIAIREELLGKGTTKKWVSLAGRILTVR